MFARFEGLNFEILTQMQKIENIDHIKGLFMHQKSNKRAKNFQGTLNFHEKQELIEYENVK